MENLRVKELQEKQVDFKRYATILLAVGAFFYLGVIIPSENKIMTDLTVMMVASIAFLAGSIYFFTKSKQAKQLLEDINELEQ